MATDPLLAATRLLAESPPGDNAAPLSVSELSGALKRTVEDRFGHVRIRGEISGWKRAASGHCYLCLKDDAAVIDGVMWKGAAGALRFRPEDGVEVIVTGRLTTYPGRSKYQVVIERMEIAGAGALMALLDQRRRALAAEGLFDADRKRPLPFLPRVIGVVTSPTGAVIRDILHRLADRCPTRVLVWPVQVQGDAAAGQVAAAVAGFNALDPAGPIPRPDLLIVARGGGSVEDLWAFNEEAVVRAVAGSAIPVISAVGHETDTSLCDFAADMRAPTPTAAAELAVPVRAELVAQLRELGLRTGRCTRRGRERAAERLDAVSRRLPTRDALLAPQRQRLDELGDRLPRALRSRVAHARVDLATAGAALTPRLLGRRLVQAQQAVTVAARALDRDAARGLSAARVRLAAVRLRADPIRQRIAGGRDALGALWRLAESLHPDRPLARGYARVERRDGRVVTDAGAARAAGALTIRFGDGQVEARVERDGRAAYDRPAGGQPRLL